VTKSTIDQQGPALSESDVVGIIRDMLGRADWMIPFIEAQVQYRSAYYGMTAAALLEDVFYDAVFNFVARFHSAIAMSKPVRGAVEAAGDYVIGQLAISHKNLRKPEDVAVHWDATVSELQDWSSECPMMVLLSGHSIVSGSVRQLDLQVVGKARAGTPIPRSIARGATWAVIRWSEDSRAEVLQKLDARPGSWKAAWSVLSPHFRTGVDQNLIDLVVVPALVTEGESYLIEIGTRPGAYLLPRTLLSAIELKSNNRGRLIPKETLLVLLERARSIGHWVPLPTWPAAYAGDRPPDLYLPQRQAFEQRFSPTASNSGEPRSGVELDVPSATQESLLGQTLPADPRNS